MLTQFYVLLLLAISAAAGMPPPTDEELFGRYVGTGPATRVEFLWTVDGIRNVRIDARKRGNAQSVSHIGRFGDTSLYEVEILHNDESAEILKVLVLLDKEQTRSVVGIYSKYRYVKVGTGKEMRLLRSVALRFQFSEVPSKGRVKPGQM